MREEEEALMRIEYRKKSWNTKFIREREIWMEIASEINGNKGRKQAFWERVMDLYHKKYKK